MRSITFVLVGMALPFLAAPAAFAQRSSDTTLVVSAAVRWAGGRIASTERVGVVLPAGASVPSNGSPPTAEVEAALSAASILHAPLVRADTAFGCAAPRSTCLPDGIDVLARITVGSVSSDTGTVVVLLDRPGGTPHSRDVLRGWLIQLSRVGQAWVVDKVLRNYVS
ncbi:MAG: hypothetical protein ACHQWU_07415 [Gemmatimonadales bacterium]